MSEEKLLNSQISALDDQALEGVAGGLINSRPEGILASDPLALANRAPEGILASDPLALANRTPEGILASDPLALANRAPDGASVNTLTKGTQPPVKGRGRC